MIVLVLIETCLLAVLTVLVAGLLRGYATVLRRLHAIDVGSDTGSSPVSSSSNTFALLPMVTRAPPPPGDDVTAPAHDIEGETLDGELVSARLTGVEHDTLLLFLSSGCESCQHFWQDLRAPVPLPPNTRLIVVPQSLADESPAELRRVAPKDVDVVTSSEAWRAYEVPGSPHAVFVQGCSGRVRGEGTGQSLRQVCELLARSTGDAAFVAKPGGAKSNRDARQESEVDRELMAAGIFPGDPRLYDGSA